MRHEDIIKKLESLRDEVDKLDLMLTALLNKRAEYSRQIGRLKKEAGMDLYSAEREEKIMQNVAGNEQEFIPGKSLIEIFRVIIRESLSIQEKENKS